MVHKGFQITPQSEIDRSEIGRTSPNHSVLPKVYDDLFPSFYSFAGGNGSRVIMFAVVVESFVQVLVPQKTLRVERLMEKRIETGAERDRRFGERRPAEIAFGDRRRLFGRKDSRWRWRSGNNTLERCPSDKGLISRDVD
ncbi:hypothetical protein TNCV_4724491 [Trichonephila clavipes]|uniref:Uncharacterized protein n=1 Tax=Trichonephila clavipes TaxID=2585209 RepID=A0A8X6W7Y7_TRICX|nr:hypothetical protein TNCV_4724491 [Trichonephila clavipes]